MVKQQLANWLENVELRKKAELGASAELSADMVTEVSPEMVCEVQLGNGGSWGG